MFTMPLKLNYRLLQVHAPDAAGMIIQIVPEPVVDFPERRELRLEKKEFMDKKWKLFPYFLLGTISFTLGLLVIKANNLLEISPAILLIFRLLSVLLLVLYAIRKRSLTTWILVCMVAGAEFGYDVPDVAKKLQFLSDIFLRLIKTITV